MALAPFFVIIAVAINASDFLTEENVVYNENKLLQTSQPLCYFFIEEIQALAKHKTIHCHDWPPMYLTTC